MASILDRYGIKEVADVTFYELGDDGAPKYPVLFLDTLKVSTIEQTAETTEARGGKGNAALISWDYNKEINVTLEDALFSVRSLAIMFGDANGASDYTYTTGDEVSTPGDEVSTPGLIMKTERFTATKKGTPGEDTDLGWKDKFQGPDGKLYSKLNSRFYGIDGVEVKTLEKNTEYFCSYDIKVSGTVIDVSANSFPGTYYITGDTFARSENSGKDEFFQFIIPKAKVTSENTITLEAEGDPSVFNLGLTVLRPTDGVMMKLVKYNLQDGEDASDETATLYHNHSLEPAQPAQPASND